MNYFVEKGSTMLKYLCSYCFCCLVMVGGLQSQETPAFAMDEIPMQDLSAFQASGGNNWAIAGSVYADWQRDGALVVTAGTGVLVNQPNDQQRANLVSVLEHGDLDLEFEFLMARHSNSGVYLQGRYEVQLLDSWGKVQAGFGDCGGIYERWDDTQLEGQKGYEGYAPRENVCRAPGLWQHMKIAFQAPRFDGSGQKIANARILFIELNGTRIHENIELTGPTRGAAFPGEARLGPLLFQGDHGAVAFRRIQYRNYIGQAPRLLNINYEFSRGAYDYPPDFKTVAIDASGVTNGLTWEAAKTKNEFGLRFTGRLQVAKAGKYNLHFTTNGNGELSINNKKIFTNRWWSRSAMVELPAGDLPIEVTYAKREGWLQPRLGVFIEGEDFRSTPLHLPSSYLLSNPVDPIRVEPRQRPEILRSFVDVPNASASNKERIVHAISVGHPDRLHFTYDADEANLVQVWRGRFLDATPMWNDRGDGSARPMAWPILLSQAPPWQPAEMVQERWPDSLSTEASYRFLGYRLGDDGMPTFQYQIYDLKVDDQFQVLDDGKILERRLECAGTPTASLLFRIAAGDKIQEVQPGIYAINDQEYYLQLPADRQAMIKSMGGQDVLLLSIDQASTIVYTIMF